MSVKRKLFAPFLGVFTATLLSAYAISAMTVNENGKWFTENPFNEHSALNIRNVFNRNMQNIKHIESINIGLILCGLLISMLFFYYSGKWNL